MIVVAVVVVMTLGIVVALVIIVVVVIIIVAAVADFIADDDVANLGCASSNTIILLCSLSCLPFHNLDLLLRQPIQLIHNPVDPILQRVCIRQQT